MQPFELICEAYMKRDLTFQESLEAIARYINYAMVQDDTLSKLHKTKGFKYYTFGNFYPPAKDKTYHKGALYRFVLRSLDETFIDTLAKMLRENTNNPHFLVVQTHKKAIKPFFITELYSATPVVLTLEDRRNWTLQGNSGITKLQQQLHDNLEKKYQTFYKEKLNPSQPFIQLLEIKNQKPQSLYFTKEGKKIRLFGNKFRIVPHEDEVSQKLAFLALGAGLGEKNSFGGGFVVAKGTS